MLHAIAEAQRKPMAIVLLIFSFNLSCINMRNNINLEQLLETAYLNFEFNYKVRGKPFINACRVRFFDKQPQVVILTELKGHGMSVTNSVEYIIPQLEKFLLLEKGILIQTNCIYIEHYDQNSYHTPSNQESFDRVILLDNRPGWNSLKREEVFLLLAPS